MIQLRLIIFLGCAIFFFAGYYYGRKRNKGVPLNDLLKRIDEYVAEQESMKKADVTISTVKAATSWCKKFAKELAK
jgi:hypothetical protein